LVLHHADKKFFICQYSQTCRIFKCVSGFTEILTPQCYYPNLYPKLSVWICLYMYRNLYPIYLVLLLSLPVSVAVWLAVSVGNSELSGLVVISIRVYSSVAGSVCRNLCLIYLVLLLSLPVPVAVWLALPVGICV
jgi:hypothetical protein